MWKQEKNTKQQRNEGEFKSFAELKKSLIERDKNDTARYKKYYGFDHQDEKHFDLVVDTTTMTPDEVLRRILKFLEKK